VQTSMLGFASRVWCVAWAWARKADAGTQRARQQRRVSGLAVVLRGRERAWQAVRAVVREMAAAERRGGFAL
jgi:hypothetical protein